MANFRDFSGRPLALLPVIAIIIFLGTIVYSLGMADSLSLGTVAACLAIIALNMLGWISSAGTLDRAVVVGGVLLAGIFAHLVISGYAFGADYGRAIGSGLVLFTCVLAASCLADALAASEFSVRPTMVALAVIFLMVAILAFFNIQPPVFGSDFSKSMFPFRETSHYAFTVTPILFYICSSQSNFWRFLALFLAVGAAILFQSLSLLVATILIGLICLPTPIAAAGVGALGLVATLGLFDLQYFRDRLDLSADTTNISSLAYRQGWELLGGALKKTWGFGIGFNQLGLTYIPSTSSDVLFRMIGNDSNLRDGGFVAAKLVAEFGIAGIAALLFYFYHLALAVPKLWLASRGKYNGSQRSLLAAALIAGYSVELFVRGGGYFSGTSVLFLTGVFYAARSREAKALENRPSHHSVFADTL